MLRVTVASLGFNNVRYCLLGRVSHGLGADTQVPIHAAGELLGTAWLITLAVAEWAIHKRTLRQFAWQQLVPIRTEISPIRLFHEQSTCPVCFWADSSEVQL